MSKLLLFFSLLLSSTLYAEDLREGFDAKASASGQTYPFGGLLTGSAGYGKALWQNTEGDFWQYGYIRPELEWKTAGVVNRLTASLEFFPISILGLSGGGGVDYRNYDKFSGVDCSSYVCDQRLDFKFVQAQLIGGFGKFVGVVIGRYDWYQISSNGRPFYDYMSYLTARPEKDDLRSLTLLALYRPDETWSYGVVAFYQQMVLSESNNSSIFGVANYKWGDWQATLGAGTYQSDRQNQNPAVLFDLQYTARRGIGLLN